MISKTENALVQSCFRVGERTLVFAIRLAIGVAIREHDTTLGEKRVGIGFNPSADNTVSQIKRLAADFIDRVNAIEPGAFEDPGEVGRLKSLSMTRTGDAAMWGSRRRPGRRRRADHEREAPPRRPPLRARLLAGGPAPEPSRRQGLRARRALVEHDPRLLPDSRLVDGMGARPIHAQLLAAHRVGVARAPAGGGAGGRQALRDPARRARLRRAGASTRGSRPSSRRRGMRAS